MKNLSCFIFTIALITVFITILQCLPLWDKIHLVQKCICVISIVNISANIGRKVFDIK